MHSRAMNTPPLSLPQRVTDSHNESVHFIRLEDGRRLAYAEFGERQAYPLFHFHSHGSSRLEAASLHKAAKRAGFRLIAVDRPGVGLSDPHRGSDAASFAQDMLVLAQKLGCQRYGLIACGGGLASALAFADLSGARATLLSGLSCAVPCTNTRSNCSQTALRLVAKHLLRATIMLRHWQASSSLETRLQRLIDSFSYADRRMFANPAMLQLLAADVTEALRQGASGVALDTAQQFMPLSLELSRLSLPCHFWLGSAEDASVRQRTEHLVSQLPHGTVHQLLNRGRYFYMRHADDIFTSANQQLGRALHRVVHAAHFAFAQSAHEQTARVATR